MRSRFLQAWILLATSFAFVVPGPAAPARAFQPEPSAEFHQDSGTFHAPADLEQASVSSVEGSSGATTGRFKRAIPVVAGDRIRVVLTAPGRASFDVSLKPPGSDPVSSRVEVPPLGSGIVQGKEQRFTFIAGAVGAFTVDVSAANSGVVYSVAWTVQSPPLQMDRYAGANRYDTALAISRRSFPRSGECTNAVLATGSNYPDALAASALAGSYDCPILLTRPDSLPPSVLTEIDRLRPPGSPFTVWIVGGTPAVSATVADQLNAHGLQVRRLGGEDRFRTAALIAAEVYRHEADDLHNVWTGEAFVANGLNYPDALAASPYAAGRKIPILLVRPDSVPSATKNALSSLHITSAFVLGSTSAVRDTTKNSLGVMSARISGPDRFVTAQRILDTAVSKGWASGSTLGFATGRNFPDALAASPFLGKNNGGLLLSERDGLGDVAYDYVAAHGRAIGIAWVFGSSAAVSDRAFWGYLDALNPVGAPPALASSPVAVAPQALPPAGLTLKYDSEFAIGQIDSADWFTSTRWGREPTNDLEHYSADALRIENGVLKISASGRGWGRPYRSGAISSFGRYQFKYGYAEIRARIPKGQGLWPAFWLGSASPEYRDEIDIMELRGQEPNKTYMIVHYFDSAGQKRQIGKTYTGPDFSTGFHTWAIDWTPDRIIWYVDGIERHRVTRASGAYIPTCDMYVVSNLAIGAWAGTVGARSVPAEYDIDYIRVYQR